MKTIAATLWDSLSTFIVAAAILTAITFAAFHDLQISNEVLYEVAMRGLLTLELLVASLVVAAVLAIAFRAWAPAALFAVGRLPIFFIAYALMFGLAVYGIQIGSLHVQFPSAGMANSDSFDPIDRLYHLVLPSLALAFFQAGVYAYYLRHRFSVIALLGAFADLLPAILSADVVVEAIYAWPGVGRLFFTSLERFEGAYIALTLLLGALLVVAVRAIADSLGARKELGALREVPESL